MTDLFLISSERGSIPAVDELSRFDNIPNTSAGTASQSPTEIEARASAAGLGCIRGTILAFAFEAVVALGIYVIWHIWRLFH